MIDEPTVYVVDDDEGARDSVRAIVRSMGVKAETFASAEQFLDSFDPSRPGCLVTDLRMLGMSGVELQENLLGHGIKLPVILITAHAETTITVRAVKTGAITVLEKPCRDFELFDAIGAALAQDKLERSQAKQQQRLSERFEGLSADEQTVLDYMMEGLANKVIAKRINVSTRTIESRRQRIFEKTGTNSLAELVQRVVELRSPAARE